MKIRCTACFNDEWEADSDTYRCTVCGLDIEEIVEIEATREGRVIGKTPTADVVTLRYAA